MNAREAWSWLLQRVIVPWMLGGLPLPLAPATGHSNAMLNTFKP